MVGVQQAGAGSKLFKTCLAYDSGWAVLEWVVVGVLITDRLVIVLTAILALLAVNRDIVPKVPGLPPEKKSRSSSTSGAVIVAYLVCAYCVHNVIMKTYCCTSFLSVWLSP